MEESSHSTPSPMSSAASSQDSLHRNAATLHYHQMHHQNPYGNLMTNTLPGDFFREKCRKLNFLIFGAKIQIIEK